MRHATVVLLLAAMAAWLALAVPSAARPATCTDPAGARCGVLGTLTAPPFSLLLFRPAAGGLLARDVRGGDIFWLSGRRLVEGDGDSDTETTFPTESAAWAQLRAQLGFTRAQAEAALAAGSPADQPDWVDRIQQPASFSVDRQTVAVSDAALARLTGACLLAPRGGRFAGLPLRRAMLIDSVYRETPPFDTMDGGRSTWQLYKRSEATDVELQIMGAARHSPRGRNLAGGIHRFYHHSILVHGRRWWTHGSQATYAGPQRVYLVARFDIHVPGGWFTLLSRLTPTCP